jgi:predicted anti-sigma-YlaC factor YlaD
MGREDEAMVHKTYQAWMQDLLDGALAAPARRQLEEHLATCAECRSGWDALSAVDRLLADAPMTAPRPGFTGRFSARLAQQRARPRLLWGAAALGVGVVAVAALVVPLGFGLLFSAARVAQQPATLLALSNSLSATSALVRVVVEALIIAGRAVLEGMLAQPLAWVAAISALALTAVWLYVMRRLVPEGSAR